MSKKDERFFLIFSIIIIVGLMLALMPTFDFDQDGAFDSLVTEGLLLLPPISFVTYYVQQDQFPFARLLKHHTFPQTFSHPPISA